MKTFKILCPDVTPVNTRNTGVMLFPPVCLKFAIISALQCPSTAPPLTDCCFDNCSLLHRKEKNGCWFLLSFFLSFFPSFFLYTHSFLALFVVPLLSSHLNVSHTNMRKQLAFGLSFLLDLADPGRIVIYQLL